MGRPISREHLFTRLRRPVPEELSVVGGSTPVISFGDPQTARVATLGLNPSRIEFLDGNGEELVGVSRRLETLESLQCSNLSTAPLPLLERVTTGCCEYFNRNPYRKWFNRLEPVLNAVGASYYDGSACHLDLVQWATDPIWRKLPKLVRSKLLADDVPFLLEQVRCARLRLLLLNGRSVVRTFSDACGIPLQECGQIRNRTRLFVGRGPRSTLVIGWSVNLQSSFGVTRELRKEIAAEVARINRAEGRD